MSDESDFSKNKSGDNDKSFEEDVFLEEQNGGASASEEQSNFFGLKQILISCKLENLFDEFVRQEVDDEFLRTTDVSNAEEWNQVAVLLPTIGAKGKFRKAIKEFQVCCCYIESPSSHFLLLKNFSWR